MEVKVFDRPLRMHLAHFTRTRGTRRHLRRTITAPSHHPHHLPSAPHLLQSG
jgi:hypothetical protein